MNRRQVLAGLTGAGLTAGSVWIARDGVPGDATGQDDTLPRTVETLDAKGSTAGSTQVPTPDTVTVVDLFATWCAPCDEQLSHLDAVRPAYQDVSFVSVTNERPGETLTKDDIADWWDRNGGNWTVGIDPGSELLAAFGVNRLPFVAIVDKKGQIVFDRSGIADAKTLREHLDSLVG